MDFNPRSFWLQSPLSFQYLYCPSGLTWLFPFCCHTFIWLDDVFLKHSNGYIIFSLVLCMLHMLRFCASMTVLPRTMASILAFFTLLSQMWVTQDLGISWPIVPFLHLQTSNRRLRPFLIASLHSLPLALLKSFIVTVSLPRWSRLISPNQLIDNLSSIINLKSPNILTGSSDLDMHIFMWPFFCLI